MEEGVETTEATSHKISLRSAGHDVTTTCRHAARLMSRCLFLGCCRCTRKKWWPRPRDNSTPVDTSTIELARRISTLTRLQIPTLVHGVGAI